MEAPRQKSPDYYRQHSILSDPRLQSKLFDELPSDPQGLTRVVQGLLIQPFERVLTWYSVKDSEIDDVGFGIRRADDLLERVLKRKGSPLSVTREPKDRIGAICRNFAFLLVSMLRDKGIPARERVGFAGYLGEPDGVWWDHRIVEYWDDAQERWILVDPMMDQVQIKERQISFNTQDIRRPIDHFLFGGEVWQGCRNGELQPIQFGDSETDIGMPPIRYALLHDFAALNKLELLGCDDWGELIAKKESALSSFDIDFLDKIAFLTVNVDYHLDELRKLFADCDYGRAVLGKLESTLARPRLG
jgi:excinuclease ABC subunit A